MERAIQNTDHRRDMSKRSASILIVDDNEVNRLITENLLIRYDAAVRQAENGRQALEMMKQKAYDLVFMDHLMPELNGIEAAREIRKMEGDAGKTVIIALSGELIPETMAKFYEAGADAILHKPLDPNKLEECLDTWLPGIKCLGGPKKKKIRNTALLNLAERMEGLDLEAGIRYCAGKEQYYIEILRSSRTLFEDSSHQLCTKTLRLSEHKNICHSLKGLLYSLGCKSLGDEFATLETQKLPGEESAGLLTKAVEKLQMFSELIGELCMAEPIPEEMPENEAELLSESELEEKKRKLSVYLERYEYDSIVQMLEELMVGSTGEKRCDWKRLLSAMREFRYEEVQEYLKKNLIR